MQFFHSTFGNTLASAVLVASGASLAALPPATPTETDDAVASHREHEREGTRGEMLLQGGEGDRVVPHVAMGVNDTTWLSWYTHTSSAYSLRLQRLDLRGKKLLGADGVLASVADSEDWVTDYGLASAKNGDALLTYTTTVDYTVRIQRFDSRGRGLWGSKGVVVTAENERAYAPSVLVLADSSIIVLWTYETSSTLGVALQRFNASGKAQWSEPRRIEAGAGLSAAWPSMLPSGRSDVLVSWMENAGFTPGDAYVQRFDRSGHAVWRSNLHLNDSDQVPFPHGASMTADGAGGAYAAWSVIKKDLLFDGFVQHFGADGVVTWNAGGVSVSNVPDLSHMISGLQVLHGKVVVTWRDMDWLQQSLGARLQAFSVDGKPQFDLGGVTVFDPAVDPEATPMALRASPGGAAVFFETGKNFPLDLTTGVATISLGLPDYWPGDTAISTVPSEKQNMAVTDAVSDGYWVIWSDLRKGDGNADLWGSFWRPPHAPRHEREPRD